MASPAEAFDLRSGVALGGGDGGTLETTGAAGGNETDLQTTSATSDSDIRRNTTTKQKQAATGTIISYLTLSKQHALFITVAMTGGPVPAAANAPHHKVIHTMMLVIPHRFHHHP